MSLWTKTILFSAVGAVLMAGGAAADETRKSFPDVPQAHWASDAVQQLANRDVLRGYPDGTFGGKRAVTRYEAATALNRVLVDTRKQIDERVSRLDSGLAAPMGPRGPQGAQGPQGPAGPRGAQGPQGQPGAGAAELPDLSREQGRLRQDVETTRELFVGLRDQIRQIRSDLRSIDEQSSGLDARVSGTHKKVRRGPLAPPRAPIGQ